ncbi:MAG: BBP7 family outer membrane beta-barrel protein [Planctomycetales bacterium]|nr:BBP7 family outer membrane beta-barrel protein [Planctomycetales bacterium]
MTVRRLRYVVALVVISLFCNASINVPGWAADGPNRQSPSDQAAGNFVDSLFEPDVPQAAPPKTKGKTSRHRTANRRPGLRAKLVNNPDTSDGSPAFALVDRYGGVLRYVEPVDNVDLQAHLGTTVTVRHDTGDILLASQLALPRRSRTGGELQLAAFQEPTPADEPESIEAGELVEGSADGEPMLVPEAEGPIYLDEGYHDGYDDGGFYDEGIDFGGCPDCGRGVAGCRGGACGFGARGVMYVHGEYLIGWLEGMNTPPLVIQDDNGNFTSPDIIYGNGPVLEGERHGGRITFGIWLDDYGKWGIEGDYLGMGTEEETFSAGVKDGLGALNNIFIGRPFFNVLEFDRDPGAGVDIVPRGRAREDVDTNGLDGTVRVDIRSEFQTAGIRLLHNLCCVDRTPRCDGCGDSVGCGSVVGCGSGVDCPIRPLGRVFELLANGVRRTDVIYGFRWASLDESLIIQEDLEELVTPNTRFQIADSFITDNDFYGGEIGFQTQWERRRWSLELLSKIAIGNTHQRVDIDGYTLNDGILTENLDDGRRGGLYAQSAEGAYAGNIGRYERDEFSVLPELGLTLGYAITPRLRATVGYTLIYWSNVLRPGDQIDLDVNGTLIPSAEVVPMVVAGDYPRFEFHQTDLWAQFLNVGAEYRW